MISDLIFNSDVFSGNILWIDNIQSTGGRVSVHSHLDVRDDLNVGKNSQLSGTLHVDKDAVLRSDLYLEDDLNVGKNSQLSGTLHVDKDAVLRSDLYLEDDLNVGKNSQLSGTLHVDKDAVLRSGLFVEGDARIDGNLYVSGDQVIMETATVRVEDKNIELAVLDSPSDITADGGGITLKGGSDKTILWNNSTDSWDFSEHVGVADGKYIFSDKVKARDSAGLLLEDDGGNGIFIEDGGDIGIGTTSPSVGLEINHTDALKIPKGTTVQRPTSSTATHRGYIRYNTTTDQFEGFGAGNAWGSLGGVIDVDQDTYISAENSAGSDNDELKFFTAGSQKAIVLANGNVGIGTTAPAYQLESFGKASNSISITSTHADSTLIQHASMFTDAAGFGKIGLFNDVGNRLVEINSNGNSFFNGGNVGIGTLTPDSELEVNGALRIGSGDDTNSGAVMLDGTIDITNGSTAIVGTDTRFQLDLRPGDLVIINTTYYFVDVISSDIAMTVTQAITNQSATGVTSYRKNRRETILASDSGNIGLGTLTPKYRLECFGKNKSSINITSDHPEADGTYTRIQHAAMSTDATGFGKLELFSDVGNTQVLVKSNGNSFFNGGNVGIGFESPNAKLHVNNGSGHFYSAANDVFKNAATLTNGQHSLIMQSGGWTNAGVLQHITGATAATTNTFGLYLNSAYGSRAFSSSSIHVNCGQSNGDIRFSIGNGDTNPMEKMRIDSAGNVGIGTSSPNEKLDLNGILYLRNSTAPTTTTNRLYAVGGELFWNGEDVRNARDTIGELEDTSIGTKSNGQLLIWNATSSRWVNNTLTGGNGIDVTNAAGAITITHANTGDQASVPASGRTYVRGVNLDEFGHVTSLSMGTETIINTNTTYTAGNGLGLTLTSFSVNSDLIGKVHSIGDSASDNISTAVNSISFKTGNALRAKLLSNGDLHVDGKVVSFSNSTASDKKLKSNIKTLYNSLDKVKNMRGVSFEWNAGNKKGQRDIGVIAQELQQVLPEVVQDTILSVGEFKDNTEKYKTVDYEKIIPVLIEAIKELSNKLDDKCCGKCGCTDKNKK